MMNHLEQLVSEWLQFNDYFVRTSTHVGPRPNGGFEGELDVVGLNLRTKHFIHVECSLDSLPDAEKQARFKSKFEIGQRYKGKVFPESTLFDDLEFEQVAVTRLAGTQERTLGGARVVTVRELIHEIEDRLKEMPPLRSAVSSNYPLLRTLQLSADANQAQRTERALIPKIHASANDMPEG